MAMTDEQFEALVSRLEQQADKDPNRYAVKLAAFAWLGYAYVAVVLLVLVAAIAGIVAFIAITGKLAWIGAYAAMAILILVVVVLSAMWVTLEPPSGLEMERPKYPRLFATIDEIRDSTKAPGVDTVLLTPELNASVVQVPRLGVLGWQKNFLVIGLPLLQMLPTEELKAVLAHEFGHLSGSHGRFGAWIYRTRALWTGLAAGLEESHHWGRFMFVPFLSWFAPTFSAYSFVKARQQEYEADRLAAETTDVQVTVDALVRLVLKEDDLAERYWPSVYSRADEQPDPDSSSPFSELGEAKHRRFRSDVEQQLAWALKSETDVADTHPSLADRISALGATPRVPATSNDRAAAALIGSELDSLTASCDDLWRLNVAEEWRQRHEYVAESRKRIAETGPNGPSEMDDDDLFEYAQRVEDVMTPDDARPLYELLQERSPDNPHATFELGRLSLAQDDEAGIAVVEQVMSSEESTIVEGCSAIIAYLRRSGRDDDIPPYLERLDTQLRREHDIWVECSQLVRSDTLLAHDMPQDTVEALATVVRVCEPVRRAWLVRKELGAGDDPLYVLAFQCKWPKSDAVDPELVAQELAEKVRIEAQLLFISMREQPLWLRRKISRVESSLIYAERFFQIQP